MPFSHALNLMQFGPILSYGIFEETTNSWTSRSCFPGSFNYRKIRSCLPLQLGQFGLKETKSNQHSPIVVFTKSPSSYRTGTMNFQQCKPLKCLPSHSPAPLSDPLQIICLKLTLMEPSPKQQTSLVSVLSLEIIKAWPLLLSSSNFPRLTEQRKLKPQQQPELWSLPLKLGLIVRSWKAILS